MSVAIASIVTRPSIPDRGVESADRGPTDAGSSVVVVDKGDCEKVDEVFAPVVGLLDRFDDSTPVEQPAVIKPKANTAIMSCRPQGRVNEPSNERPVILKWCH